MISKKTDKEFLYWKSIDNLFHKFSNYSRTSVFKDQIWEQFNKYHRLYGFCRFDSFYDNSYWYVNNKCLNSFKYERPQSKLEKVFQKTLDNSSINAYYVLRR